MAYHAAEVLRVHWVFVIPEKPSVRTKLPASSPEGGPELVDELCVVRPGVRYGEVNSEDEVHSFDQGPRQGRCIGFASLPTRMDNLEGGVRLSR